MPSLLPGTRCALTAPFHPYPYMYGRFAFCGTGSRVAPAGRYPAPCFRGARTFLTLPGFPIARRGHPAAWPDEARQASGRRQCQPCKAEYRRLAVEAELPDQQQTYFHLPAAMVCRREWHATGRGIGIDGIESSKMPETTPGQLLAPRVWLTQRSLHLPDDPRRPVRRGGASPTLLQFPPLSHPGARPGWRTASGHPCAGG